MRLLTRPRQVPAIIGTAFGGLWAFLAAMALPINWQTPVIVLAVVVTTFLMVRLWTARQSASGARQRLFGRRAYQIAVVVEIAAIYAASAIVPGLGWQSYFVQIVGIIVGLHFIGLWRATGSSRFLLIATAMCAVSAIALPFPTAVGTFHVRDFITGAGDAIVLWLGASGLMERQA